MTVLELVIRCKKCGQEIDQWDLDDADPALSVCEIHAGDLDFAHDCPAVEQHHDQCPWATADPTRQRSVCGCPEGWPKWIVP